MQHETRYVGSMIAIHDIFDALGGPAAIARELRIKPSTASEMKRRGSIPAEYWAELTAIAERRRHPEINADLLAALHARQSRAEMAGDPSPEHRTVAVLASNIEGAEQPHFARFKHLRRMHFKTSAEINDHIRALRDEWDRR